MHCDIEIASKCHQTENFLSVNSIQLSKCKSLYITNCKKYRKTNNEFMISRFNSLRLANKMQMQNLAGKVL